MAFLPELARQQLVFVLMHFLWQGALICVFLSALVSVLGLKRPGVRYAFSLGAFGLMAVCPVVTWTMRPLDRTLSRNESPIVESFGSIAPGELLEAEAPGEAAEIEPARPALSTERNPFGFPQSAEESSTTHVASPGIQPAQSTPTPTAWPSASHWLATFEPWVSGGWLVGVLLLSLRLLASLLGVRRWRRSAAPLEPKLAVRFRRICDALGVPASRVHVSYRVGEAMAVGLLRPIVLLPAAWVSEFPVDMLEAVIAHELAHLRRYDLWVNLLQRIVETLLFYHPAVWWLSRRLRIERELCCDEIAVAATRDRVRYVETLEHVARSSWRGPPVLGVAMSSSQGVLLQRVRHLLRLGRQPSQAAWVAGLLTLLVVSLTSISIYGGMAANVIAPEEAGSEIGDSSVAAGFSPVGEEASSSSPLQEPGNPPSDDSDDLVQQAILLEPTTDHGPRLMVPLDKDLASAERRLRTVTRARQSANKQNLDKPNSTSPGELERMRLEIELAKAEVERWRAVRANNELDELELQLCQHRIRLARQELELAVLANVEKPGSVAKAVIRRLRDRTRVRWGLPQDGVQVGLELLNGGVCEQGDKISFRFRVRNASMHRLKTRLHYRPAEQTTFRTYQQGRILIGLKAKEGAILDLDLAPGEHVPTPRTTLHLETKELRVGKYQFATQILMRHGEGDDIRKLTQLRGPSSRSTSVLPLSISLSRPRGRKDVANAAGPIDVGKEAFDVFWGPVNQGLQAGLRYTRGMKHPNNYSHPDNWSWDPGEQVQADLLVRNVQTSPMTLSYILGHQGDLTVIRPGAHSVTRYDHLGAIQRRFNSGGRYLEFDDSGRRRTKSLQPGQSFIFGRASFVVKPTHPDKRHRYKKQDMVLVTPGERYRFKTRPRVLTASGGVTIALATGGIPLWVRGDDPAAKAPDVEEGRGRLSVRFHVEGGPAQAEIVIQRVSSKGEPALQKIVKNGGAAATLELPSGRYLVARRVQLRVGNFRRTELCDRQSVLVKRGGLTQVRLERAGPLAVERRAIKDFAQWKLAGAFITVHRAAKGDWNSGEPAKAYDFRAERVVLCATTCDAQGRYALEPLPAGRYLVVARALPLRSNAMLALGGIRLPHLVGCHTIQIYTDRDDEPFFSRFPNELQLWENWDYPQWMPEALVGAQPVSMLKPKRSDKKAVRPDVAKLMQQVAGRDKQQRGDAIAKLGLLGEQAAPAIPLLIKQLSESKLWVDVSVTGPRMGSPIAGHAERALQAIGQPAAPLLGEALRNKDLEIARRAATLLGRIKAPASIPPLVDALARQDRQLAGNAATALGHFGAKAVPPLLDALTSSSPRQRNLAAGALGETRRPQVVEPLIQAIVKGDDDLQLWASYALEKLRTDEGRTILARPANVKLLIASLKTDQRRVHNSLAATLAFVSEDARDLLLASLEDEDPRVRSGVTVAVGNLRDPRLVSRLISQIDGGDPERSRARALYALGNQVRDLDGLDPVLPTLLAALEDESHEIRQAAASALSSAQERFRNDRRAVQPLILAMQREGESYALFQLVQTLGLYQDATSVEPLIALLKRDELWRRQGEKDRAEVKPRDAARRDTDIRAQICRALASTGQQRAIPPLRELLSLREPAVVEALGRLGDRDSRAAFNTALAHQDPAMRRAGAIALTHTPDIAAIPALAAQLQRTLGRFDMRGGDFNLCLRLSEALSATGEPRAAELLVSSMREPFKVSFRDEQGPDDLEFRVQQDPRARPLAKMGVVAIPAILQELQRPDERPPLPDSSPSSRVLSAWALYDMVVNDEFSTASNTECVPTLIGVLEDDDKHVQILVAKTLGWLKAEEAVEGLVGLLATDRGFDDDVVEAAANALSHIGAKSAADPLARLLKHDDPGVRIAAIYGVSSAEHPNAAALLHDVLINDGVRVRSIAARQLGFVGDSRSVELLSGLLKKETDVEALHHAIQSLGMLGEPAAIPALLPFLSADQSRETRTRSALAMLQLNDDRGMPALRTLFNANEARPRERVMTHASLLAMFAEEGLGAKLEHTAGRDFMRNQARTDPSPRVRLYGALALRGFSDRPTVDTLLAMAKDKDPGVRHSAITVLARTTDSRRIAALQAALRDAAVAVRVRALTKLVETSPQVAARELAGLLDDKEERVRIVAVQAVATLASQQHSKKISQMAGDDPSPKVRREAKNTHKTLAVD